MISTRTILLSLLFDLLMIVAMGVTGYFWGVHNARTACEAAKVVPLVQSIEQHNEKVAVGQVVERQAARQAAKTESFFTGVERGVLTHAQTHPVAGDCSLDADGLRLWRDANRGPEADGAGAPQDGLP